DVVLGRDDDLGVRVDALVAAPEFGAALGEDGFVLIGLPLCRLVRDRPEGAGVRVAQVAEAPPRIGRAVLVPARHGEIFPAAVTSSRVRQHDVVAAVREQLYFGRGRYGRRDEVLRRVG